MTLPCILYYIASALLGGLLSWLLFGGKSGELNSIKAAAQRDRGELQNAIAELNTFKNKAKAQIATKESEISKLKKTTALPDIITKAQDKEIKHWKQKAKDLESELKQAKKSVSSKADPQDTNLLEKELESAYQSLKEKSTQLKELKQVVKDKEDSSEEMAPSKDLKKLKKKLKKLKKKLKAQKLAMSEIHTIEIRETLDLDKLSKLLSQGKLTSKTKKVSKKKARKKIKSDS